MLTHPGSPFRNLDARSIAQLAQSFELFEYTPGDIIMQKGVMGRHLYLLDHGGVELFNVKYGQKPVLVTTIDVDKDKPDLVLGKFNSRMFGLTSLRLAPPRTASPRLASPRSASPRSASPRSFVRSLALARRAADGPPRASHASDPPATRRKRSYDVSAPRDELASRVGTHDAPLNALFGGPSVSMRGKPREAGARLGVGDGPGPGSYDVSKALDALKGPVLVHAFGSSERQGVGEQQVSADELIAQEARAQAEMIHAEAVEAARSLAMQERPRAVE